MTVAADVTVKLRPPALCSDKERAAGQKTTAVKVLSDLARLAYDPRAGKFTTFDLPTRGSEARYVSLYEKDGHMKVVLPSYRTRKVTVMSFRSEVDLAAAKAQAR